MTTKREERIAEVNQMAMEWDCSFRDALLEILFMLYNSVFPDEYLEQEFSPKTDEELLDVFMTW